MTEKPEEGGSGELESVGLPVPKSSTPSGAPLAERVGLDEATLDRKLKAFEDNLEKRLRGLQSGTDKQIRRVLDLSKYLPDVSPEVLARAEREAQIDEIIQGRSASTEPDPGKSGASDKRMERYARRLLSSAGISFKDPEYLDLVKKHSGRDSVDEDSFYDDLEDLAEKRKAKASKEEAQAPGAIVTEGAGRVPGSNPNLEKDYRAEMNQARGKGNAVGKTIKEKYRKLGLDVDSINLA